MTIVQTTQKKAYSNQIKTNHQMNKRNRKTKQKNQRRGEGGHTPPEG